MPKYCEYKVAGYYLYFTSKCTVEAFHVHANGEVKRAGSAKLFVYKDGSTKVQRKGKLSNKSIKAIQEFIKVNHVDMYQHWKAHDPNGGEYYRGE